MNETDSSFHLNQEVYFFTCSLQHSFCPASSFLPSSPFSVVFFVQPILLYLFILFHILSDFGHLFLFPITYVILILYCLLRSFLSIG